MFWLKSGRIRLVIFGVMSAMVVGGSAKADFTFGEPINLGPTVNSEASEYSHCVSADGLELYLGSYRDGGYGSGDIWVSKRATREEEWDPPENLGPVVNTASGELSPCLSVDGLELYFHSEREVGGLGASDIWVSRRTAQGEPWGEPVNLGAPINTELDDYNPCLSGDGLELYFVHGRWDPEDAPTEESIYVTRRATVDDLWGEPEDLGPVVNSHVCQDTPWISSDGRVLMFTDAWICDPRPGGYGETDIWMVRRTDEHSPWSKPVNLGLPINSYFDEDFPMISADGSTLYFNSRRPGGSGRHDLWQAPIVPVVDFDGDGTVGLNDLTLMVESWGTDDPRYDIGPMPWGDGTVDADDLDVLMASWGQAVDFPYDPVKASNPMPADGSTILNEDSSLSWTPGWYAVQHDVYLGQDPGAVENADISDVSGIYRGRQDSSRYTPPGALDSGATFFWRIDEIHTDGTIIKGPAWSFTVADLLVVDDFENYIAEGDMLDPRQIYMTWIDGWDDPENGSQVGYAGPPFVELTIVHGGLQSMPFFYDNSNAPISRTFREWPDPQDWTVRGVQVLTLWLYGEQDNSADPFYVGLEDSAGNRRDITHRDPAVLTVNDWQQWRIPLADFTNVDLSAIKIMYIGVGDSTGNQPGGLGKLFIDDIELHSRLGQ